MSDKTVELKNEKHSDQRTIATKICKINTQIDWLLLLPNLHNLVVRGLVIYLS